MRRKIHFSNSPLARDDDLIDDNGWRDGGNDAQRTATAAGRQRSWTVVVAKRAKRGFVRKEF